MQALGAAIATTTLNERRLGRPKLENIIELDCKVHGWQVFKATIWAKLIKGDLKDLEPVTFTNETFLFRDFYKD